MPIRTTILPRAVLLSAICCLLSCESGDPAADLEMDLSMSGADKATTFTMNADGAIRLKDLAVAGETIRVARKLNKSEAEILRLLAQKKFDGFMVSALEELRPKYEKKKEVVRQATARKVQAIKATAEAKVAAIAAPAGAESPDAQAVRQQSAAEVARVTQEESRQIAFIDTEWRQEAVDKIRSTYGTNFAVPVKGDGNTAAVAFASVDDKGVARASDTAYALNNAPDVFLAKAASGRAVVAHQGGQSLVLDAPPPF